MVRRRRGVAGPRPEIDVVIHQRQQSRRRGVPTDHTRGPPARRARRCALGRPRHALDVAPDHDDRPAPAARRHSSVGGCRRGAMSPALRRPVPHGCGGHHHAQAVQRRRGRRARGVARLLPRHLVRDRCDRGSIGRQSALRRAARAPVAVDGRRDARRPPIGDPGADAGAVARPLGRVSADARRRVGAAWGLLDRQLGGRGRPSAHRGGGDDDRGASARARATDPDVRRVRVRPRSSRTSRARRARTLLPGPGARRDRALHGRVRAGEPDQPGAPPARGVSRRGCG